MKTIRAEEGVKAEVEIGDDRGITCRLPSSVEVSGTYLRRNRTWVGADHGGDGVSEVDMSNAVCVSRHGLDAAHVGEDGKLKVEEDRIPQTILY